MSMNEFVTKVEKAMGEIYGREADVLIQDYKKNNGVILHGLTVRRQSDRVVPTIYIDSYYERYTEGESLGDLVQELFSVYENGAIEEQIDMSFFKEYAKVRERICIKLISVCKNRDLLPTVPFMPFLDLAVVFFYSYEDDVLGRGSIQITNSHMELWNVSLQELYEDAIRNSVRLFPPTHSSILDVLLKMYERTGNQDLAADFELSCFAATEELPMLVATNTAQYYGAATLAYPGYLEMVSKQLEGDFYILPSSIHETIFLPAGKDVDEEYLRHMIREINETQVEPVEVLSDTLYYYDCSKERVTIA